MSGHVIVTGASRGIGLAIASDLLDAGHAVTAAARNPSEGIEALARAHGDALAFVSADVASEADRQRLVDEAETRAPVYGLVNNAAVPGDGLLVRQHSADVERTLAVNLVAPIELSRLVSRHMFRRREGRIVSISSIAAGRAYPGLSVYAAAKAGLEGFTRTLARELGPRGITVNAVAPGFVDTDMSAGLSAEQRERIARRAPLPGTVAAADVGPVVRFLLSPAARQITGTVVPVDGGASL